MAIIITLLKIYGLGFVLVILISCFLFRDDFKDIKIYEPKRLKSAILNLIIESARWPQVIYLLAKAMLIRLSLNSKNIESH